MWGGPTVINAVWIAAAVAALLLVGAVLGAVHRSHRRPPAAAATAASPATPAAPTMSLERSTGRRHSAEEDRIRPATAPDGEPVWVETDDLLWHEIVAWPLSARTDLRDDTTTSHRTA